MGRPPLGKVAMSDSERHRRYMTRLRQRAAASSVAAPAPAAPMPFVAPDGLTIRLSAFIMDPVRTARWLRQELDKRGKVEAFDEAWLAGQTPIQSAPAGAAEIERLQEAKRRALAIADERSKENSDLRAENERLRAALSAVAGAA